MDNLTILTLLFIPKLGPIRIKAIMTDKNIVSNNDIKDYLLTSGMIANISIYTNAEQLAKKAYEKHKRMDILTVGFNDIEYPKSLWLLGNPPILLFYKGNLNEFSMNMNIGIIGMTNPTQYGKKAAYRIGERIAELRLNVISGLAKGIDAEAHKGCIEANGNTLAVLPSPIDNIYPSENIKLANRILESNGCIVSEYPSGTIMSKYHFIARDRLQAAFSNKIIVVETPEMDGTMHTVKFAKKMNKGIGVVVPNNIKMEKNKNFSGNLRIIQNYSGVSILNKSELKIFLR